jgi:hypothetical protein
MGACMLPRKFASPIMHKPVFGPKFGAMGPYSWPLGSGERFDVDQHDTCMHAG